MTTTEIEASPCATQGEGGGFDYEGVSEHLARKMQGAARDIRRCTRDALVEVGKRLLEIKDLIEYGQFITWVETGCGLRIRTAQRAMQVAELVIKYVNLTYLPPDGLLLLASRSVAQPLRDEIIQRIDNGERPTAADIKRALGRELAVRAGKRDAVSAGVQQLAPPAVIEDLARTRVKEAVSQSPQAPEPKDPVHGGEYQAKAVERVVTLLIDGLGADRVRGLISDLEVITTAELANALQERLGIGAGDAHPDASPGSFSAGNDSTDAASYGNSNPTTVAPHVGYNATQAKAGEKHTVSAERLIEIYQGLKPNTQKRAPWWLQRDCPLPDPTDENIGITEGLAEFRAAAAQASPEEQQRFLLSVGALSPIETTLLPTAA